MSELAACPFCGGEPNVMLIEAHHEGQTRRIAIPLTDKWYEGVRCEHHPQWMTPEQWNRRANASAAVVEWPEEPSEVVINAACSLIMYRIRRRMADDNDAPGIVQAQRELYLAMRAAHIAEYLSHGR